MSILSAFEDLSLAPFCSPKEKDNFIKELPNQESKNNFLKGDQLSLRISLSSEYKRFADAVDVVSFFE